MKMTVSVQIIASLITLGGMGFLLGVILAYSSHIFYVDKDPYIEKINEILPGTNCGACGYPGCSNYAEAIVNEKAPIDRCASGGKDVVIKISGLMGIEAEFKESMIAVVRCKGAKEIAKDRFQYNGIRECNAAVLVQGGHKACVYGCLGFGSCAKACPFDAIRMQENNLPYVLEEKCTGCGICVNVCPRGIMELIPRYQKVFLGCVNKDSGKAVREVCSVGCIACGLCTKSKTTPSGKLKMKDNLPDIPPEWEDFNMAVEKCPTNSFVVRIPYQESDCRKTKEKVLKNNELKKGIIHAY